MQGTFCFPLKKIISIGYFHLRDAFPRFKLQDLSDSVSGVV